MADALQLALDLQKKQQALRNYINNVWPNRAGNIGLRFIDGNFRAQGWQGSTFQRWKPIKRKGSILIRRANLKRGNRYTPGTAQVRFYNMQRYARVHNEGFRGTVTISAHERRNYSASKVSTGRTLKSGRAQTRTVHTVSGVSTVKQHTRRMNIEKRQFMPTRWNDSPVLVNAWVREIEREVKNIFK